MEVDSVDPSTVNKNPKLIKDAQEDASKLDILVCGTCRNVFHFIEDFKQHKEHPCPTSTYSSQETKPQVWAFLLWKSAIANKEKAEGGGTSVNAWKMYQEWSKMEEEVKENWITAGKALQSFSMIASAKLQEVRSPNDGKSSSVRTVGEIESKEVSTELKQEQKRLPGEKGGSELKKGSSQQWNNVSLEVGSNKVKTSIIKKDDNDKKEVSDSVKEAVERKNLGQDNASGINNENKSMTFEGDDTIEIKEEKLSEEEGSRGPWDVEDMDITSEVMPGRAPSETPFIKKKNEPPRPDSNKVTRRSLNRLSNEGSSEDEYVVEKILAKRFNPKKKYYEYLLKWEGYPHEQNTWEPVHNMAACDKLVETFERNLAKQKAAQQAQMQAQKLVTNSQNVSARKVIGHSSKETILEASPGPSGLESSRPVRSSKKKALEQVKSWCGSMAKTTEFGKRKVGESSDSDEDDISEKKVKLEPPDDDDWSSGELACSQGSSGEENVVAIHGNQAKVVGVIHKAKEQLISQPVKRTPGRPRKLRTDEAGAVNGMKPRKSDEANDLAVKLGLESDSSPESKSRSPQSGNKLTSQPPVLVANSKGVIKVDPRQVPNLTSGVYIVANKSNVVKLESLPSSPPKGKVIAAKTPPGKMESSVKPGLTSGIVRKSGASQVGAPRLRPLAPAPPPVKLLPKPTPGQLAGVLLGGPGLMKVAPQLTQRTVITSPRSVATTPRILGPRPTAVLQPRGTLLQSSLRPNTPTGSVAKRPIGIPGVQTKITSAVRPRLPTAGKVVSPLTAQTKSGVKPIQAMLGKAVQGQSLANAGLLSIKKNGEGLLKSGIERVPLGLTKPGVRVDDDKPRKGVGRGRGRGGGINANNDILGKSRDSKLSDNDNLHMEFHELSSSESDSDDSLPELPMGDLPSLEPDSPPRPFTLCPETGKILGRAEGEPSPPPSPIPAPEPPAPTSVPVSSASAVTIDSSVTKDNASPAPGAHESEEILPDRREEASPLSFSESNETLLKVEMSPGGTTGTVIESSVPNSQFVDTLRTEQGVTVTKIPAEMGAKTSDQVVTAPQPASPTAGKAGGGISVPARKLFMEGGKLNTEVVTVTGEDGVVYQIATEGQEEIEGGEGMQQCVYVTTDQAEGSEEGAVLTLDTAVAEAVAQLMPDQVIGGGCPQFYIKEGEDTSVADNSNQLVMTSVVDQSGTDENAQVVAHVVQEGEIIPGTGKRRVVLLLPDGNLMMTDVDEEQYAALNLDK